MCNVHILLNCITSSFDVWIYFKYYFNILFHFIAEVHCINETEGFLAELVHDIGIDLRSTAVCTQLRQTQFGPFVLQHALLRKHWTLENILNNLTLCQAVLKEESSTIDSRTVKALKQNHVIEQMQNIARKGSLWQYMESSVVSYK